MKIPRILTGTALCGLLALSLAGCGKSDSSTSSGGGAGGGGGDKPLHLAFVTNNSAPFWVIAEAGVAQAKSELQGVTVDFRRPAGGGAADQKTVIDDLVANGVDGLAISPIDPANMTGMINDLAKQVLVFTQDSDAPASDRACYIGTDNKAAGKQAGELLKKALPNGGKIMVFVGKIDAQNAKDRFEGIKEDLQGTNIQILDVRTDNADPIKAKSNVADTLVTVPDVAGLVGLYSYNGPAILSALKDAGKVGQIKVVCFDEEDDTLRGVSEGAIFATVVQQPFEFGRQAVINMAKYLRGDKTVVPDSKAIYIPTVAIDKSNVDDFTAKLHKMLGKS
jgi:ribose transport system substrate-binding protein